MTEPVCERPESCGQNRKLCQPCFDFHLDKFLKDLGKAVRTVWQ